MQYCLSDMLGVKQRETLFYCILRSVLVESHIIVELSKLKEELNSALALLERDFPISIQARNVTCMRWVFYYFWLDNLYRISQLISFTRLSRELKNLVLYIQLGCFLLSDSIVG